MCDFWVCGLKTSLLSLTTSQTCPGMFFLAIFKRLLMIKMAMSMCCFTLRHGPSLAWNEMTFILSSTLPFGWKACAYLYHNFTLAVTSATRLFGVPMSQYIDDHHVYQLSRAPASSTLSPDKVLAEPAAYILCHLLIQAGYFIAIRKSQRVPSIVIHFLCHSFC